VVTEAAELAGLLRIAHRRIDQSDHGLRVAMRVVAIEQVAVEPLLDELLGRDEHLRLGAPKAIDALLRIADDEHAGAAPAGARIAAEPAMERLPLQRIGVLELVDEQMPHAHIEALLHPAPQFGVAEQQMGGLLDVVHVDPAVGGLDLGKAADQEARQPRHALLV
jgi:hypothetical protein